ncbi:hypothetical protein [Cellulosimicrobium sp. SL-1]|uniref:hypothetical protein n=1 Tax=Cellulosimicrobium sp. SL-1 TaxID=2699423 RepID=UPI0013D225A8|nr:hypothetical protein [Cellulosimicrobium sp. SL-1]
MTGAGVPRALTARERDVLVWMLGHGCRGEAVAPDRDAADRGRWLAQVDAVRVHGTCACGACPTIDLGDDDGPVPAQGPRVVLEAGTDRFLLLLFVDDDRLSCLELAPVGDEAFPAFPPVATLAT